MNKLIAFAVVVLLTFEAQAQIGVVKLNPFLIGHYQGYLEVPVVDNQSAQVSIAYTPNTSESTFTSISGDSKDQTIEATTLKTYLSYRFYFDEVLTDSYISPFFVYKKKTEDVDVELDNDFTDYSHSRKRNVLGIGALYGRQIHLGRNFVLDCFGGLWLGQQTVSDVEFNSETMTTDLYEANVLDGKSFNRFRWSPRLGVSIGYQF